MKNFSGEIIALDIGGTKIYGCRYSSSFKVLDEITVRTESGKRTLENITTTISRLKTSKVKAISIAFAGFINPDKGIIIHSPNISGLKNVRLASILKKQFRLPVFIDNDANLFALAESRLKKSTNLLGIIVGTGVGSGIIINNSIYHGHDYLAGEIGHAFANIKGTSVIERLITQKSTSPVHSRHISRWLAGLILTFNPQTIVFGGGIGTHLIRDQKTRIIKEVKNIIKKLNFPARVDIRISQIKNSGALGAAILAQEKLMT